MSQASELAVEAHGLVKQYRSVRALDGLDLSVPIGTIYGILGPNGAGKTTAIRVLATLLQAEAGTARVMGYDVVEQAEAVRRRISLAGQFAAVDDDLTATENLRLLGRLLGLSRADAGRRAEELLDAFGLTDAAGRQVKSYSGGMRRRVDLAASIILTPELLFLDEPTTGLDPKSRSHIWETVRAMATSGTTVLLTTQYLEEADRLADRVAVVDHGTVIAEGTPSSLKASIGVATLTLSVTDPQTRTRAADLVAASLGAPVHLATDPVTLSANATDLHRVAELLHRLRWEGVQLGSFAVDHPSLDEVFLALTGRPVAETGHPTEEVTA